MPRPSKSDDPKILAHACALAAAGGLEREIAEELEVSLSTLRRWRNNSKMFANALAVGKKAADDRVERSLYELALGYEYEATKVFCQDGVITKVTYTEHVPPNPTAIIFWLKNRKREVWRDRVEHTGPEGEPLVPPIEEIARRVAFVLALAAGGQTDAPAESQQVH